jgi:hypothetical protein
LRLSLLRNGVFERERAQAMTRREIVTTRPARESAARSDSGRGRARSESRVRFACSAVNTGSCGSHTRIQRKHFVSSFQPQALHVGDVNPSVLPQCAHS